MILAPRWIATAAYLGLAALQPVWHLLWYPPQVIAPGWAAAAGLVPLLPLLPGVLRDRPRAWAWGSFLALPYFMHGTVEAWVTPAVRPAAFTETGLALLLMAAVTLRLRHPPPAR